MRTRSLREVRSDGDARWFARGLETVRSLGSSADPRLSGFFSPSAPLLFARAPGRLDVMGGIADYSGSLVLELPLAVSTHAVLQPRGDARIELASLREDGVHFASASVPALTDERGGGTEPVGAWLRRELPDWAVYVLGVAQLCTHMAMDRGALPRGGYNLLLTSDVPEGKGVSSSAALEIATMSALSGYLGLELAPEETAAACQWVENHIVGAPCGIMDQLTSVRGRRDRLLRIRCQPARVEGDLEIPPGYRFFGIDSGERHAVGGHDYTAVRTAAFMGYRIIAARAGLRAEAQGDRVTVEDPRWGGYLANLSPHELASEFLPHLPERMEGGEFLARYGGSTDAVTRVQPGVEYPVRAATVHPVRENARVEQFAELLERLPSAPSASASSLAGEMGRLMLESHASYGACGLGSPGTDRLVEMVREMGAGEGLFGAKITGGGSGGTVAVFARADADPAVRALAERYGRETGTRPEVFTESGPGAEATGVAWGRSWKLDV